MLLQGKTIVLTGASGGLGTAIAHLLAAKNQLILIGRNISRLHRLQSELNGEHHVIAGDLSTTDGCFELVSKLTQLRQPIDVLINNAGQTLFSSFEHENHARIESLIATNLTAPMLLTRGLQPSFNADGCKVVNVGSTFGSIGYPGFSIYSASKFGLRGFSEALSREWAQSPHSVLYVAPRAISTQGNSRSIVELNSTLGNKVDSPACVARQVVNSIESNRTCTHFGWPEKILAPINMLLPAVISKALAQRLGSIKKFMKESSHASV